RPTRVTGLAVPASAWSYVVDLTLVRAQFATVVLTLAVCANRDAGLDGRPRSAVWPPASLQPSPCPGPRGAIPCGAPYRLRLRDRHPTAPPPRPRQPTRS